MLKLIFVCLLAGLGAGISTGFAGLSAAVFITPMLVTFLNVPVYDAVGIALASDVLASAISAYTYGRQGNIDLKRGRPVLVLVLLFAIAGSLLAFVVTSTDTGDTILSYWSVIASLLLGLSFIWNSFRQKEKQARGYGRRRKLMAVICSIYIGFVCGFQGTGGGMMLLFTLTVVMLMEFKHAVGTSVFIMTFTALIGAIAHFLVNGFPNPVIFALCVIFTAVFARIGAVIANRLPQKRLKLITGILLAISGLIMLVVKIGG